MADFADKIRMGVVPSHQDWEAFLIEAHARNPQMTPASFSGYRTDEGLNSYEVLAAEVPHLNRDVTVVDLACGDGHLIPYLLPKLTPDSKVTGVDMSVEGLEVARARIREPRVNFIEAKAQALPFPDQSADFILCHMALMLMAPVEPVLKEIGRILKPGGRFAAVFSGGEPQGLYRKIRRITSLFVQTHIPKYIEARASRTSLGNLAGFEVRDFHLHHHVFPEGVWDYMGGMYFIPIMPEFAQLELKDELLALANDHRDQSGKVTFNVPMKMVSYLKS